MPRNLKPALGFAVLLAVLCGAASGAQSPDTAYLIEAKVITIEQDAPKLDDAPSDVEALLGLLENAPGHSVLAAPRVLVRAGQEAEISIGQELQYLERREDGTFVLRTLTGEQSAGIHLEVKAEPAGAGKVRLASDLSIAVLQGRAPVPGVKLDVGLPLLSVTEVDTQTVVELGEWVKIAGQQFTDTSSGKPERLVVIARVTAAPADEGFQPRHHLTGPAGRGRG